MFPPELTPENSAAQAAKREQAVRAFQACRQDFIQAQLKRMGLAKHELTAQWVRIPEAIKKVLPKTLRGFGLSGGFGAGKTFAVAAVMSRIAERSVDRHMAAMVAEGDWYDLGGMTKTKRLPLPVGHLWCNWPGEAAERRAQLFRNQHGEVEDWILSLQDPNRLVVLDDLGADRATAQDWAGEVLARVIDERLRCQGTTLWTSNLDAKGLMDRYGPRTFSRLHALAPMILLPKLPDLRLLPARMPESPS